MSKRRLSQRVHRSLHFWLGVVLGMALVFSAILAEPWLAQHVELPPLTSGAPFLILLGLALVVYLVVSVAFARFVLAACEHCGGRARVSSSVPERTRAHYICLDCGQESSFILMPLV